MSNSLCRIASQNSGQNREKNSSTMTHCGSIYNTELNGSFRISERSNIVVPRRKSFQCSHQLMNEIFTPKQEARNTSGLESWGSCNNLKDRTCVVLECGDEKILKIDKRQNWTKKDVDVPLPVTLAAIDDLQRDHCKMLRVLKSRKSAIETVVLKLEREGYDGLLLWLITSGEDTVTADLIPQLCKRLQKRRDDRTSVISPMLALMLIPSVLSLLSSRYEDYILKALDYIEAFLCEIQPPRCPLYDSQMQELNHLLVSLNADSRGLLQSLHETCFKIQNCLQLVQHRKTV